MLYGATLQVVPLRLPPDGQEYVVVGVAPEQQGDVLDRPVA